jgi:DNA-binding transcriptional LysR family regulator
MQQILLNPLNGYKIKQLKTFKVVTECGGFSSAQAVLNISRTTISNHIAALESQLNVVLCERGKAGYSLTEEGRVVYDQTCQLLTQLEQLGKEVNNLGQSS